MSFSGRSASNSRLIALSLFAALTVALASPTRAAQQTQTPPDAKPKKGALQEQAITRVEPVYPPLARAARVSGPVVVEVTVDEQGDVMSARAVSGHPLLADSAVKAAKQWKFNPTELSGTRVKVIGTLTFNFNLPTEEPKSPHQEPPTNTVAALERAARTNPNSDEAHYKLAVAYIEANRYAPAIVQLKEAIRLNPDSAESHYKLGVVYSYTNRFEEALKELKQSVTVDPGYWNNDEAYFGIGSINLKLKRYREAIEPLEEATRLAPSAADAHLSLGTAHFMLREYAEALDSFSRAVEINPKDPLAHHWLGKVYVKLGKREFALKEYNILKRLDRRMANLLMAEIRRMRVT